MAGITPHKEEVKLEEEEEITKSILGLCDDAVVAILLHGTVRSVLEESKVRLAEEMVSFRRSIAKRMLNCPEHKMNEEVDLLKLDESFRAGWNKWLETPHEQSTKCAQNVPFVEEKQLKQNDSCCNKKKNTTIKWKDNNGEDNPSYFLRLRTALFLNIWNHLVHFAWHLNWSTLNKIPAFIKNQLNSHWITAQPIIFSLRTSPLPVFFPYLGSRHATRPSEVKNTLFIVDHMYANEQIRPSDWSRAKSEPKSCNLIGYRPGKRPLLL